MFISAVVGSPSRFKGADYSAPWMASPFSILIPISNSSANVGALIEPMSTEVYHPNPTLILLNNFYTFCNFLLCVLY